MPLELNQIKELLKQPTKNRRLIDAAKRHESRLKLHSQSSLSGMESSVELHSFLELARDLLTDKKYAMYLSLLRFPVPTVTLIDKVFTAIEKIFDGRNPVTNHEFIADEHADEYREYRNSQLKLMDILKTKGVSAMKSAINSILIVDIPAEQQGERPEPYFYFLPLNMVVDFEIDENGNDINWIFFKQPGDRLAVFDDTSYRVFQTMQGNYREIIEPPIVENEHGLGTCPARTFWTTPIDYKKPFLKKAPHSNQLGRLDYLLFFEVGNEHLNLYARYPIYVVYKSNCNFIDRRTGEYCQNGYLLNKSHQHLLDGNKLKRCPNCERKSMVGAGSKIEVDPPSEANNFTDLSEPVRKVGADKPTLDYNNEDIDRRKAEIYKNVTGFQGMPINNKAVNEKQVVAMFESLESALKVPQRNFELAINWLDSTIAKLRYPDTYVSSSTSLGTEHYIMSASQILELYNAARESAISATTLDLLEGRYYSTEFRNNPEQLQRQIIISNLDPVRHKTTQEVTDMFESGAISFHDYMIKVNLSSLIFRFERENLPLNKFGLGIPFDTRIDRIKAALIVYANEMRPVAAPIE